MTDGHAPDYAEMRRLAEAADSGLAHLYPEDVRDYRDAANPATILALLDEREALITAANPVTIIALIDERAALIARAEQVGAAHEETAAKLNTTLHVLGRTMDRAEKAEAEAAALREALDAVSGFAKVDMRGCYERELRDIIRSMTDCAARALTGGDHG